MQNLTRANQQLFSRGADERFATLSDLSAYCRQLQEHSTDRWIPPGGVCMHPEGGILRLATEEGDSFDLNDWSFSQLCGLSGVTKETVNRLTPDTAAQVFKETLPGGIKPLQLFTMGNHLRSIHGASYTRLHNLDLLALVQEFATDFTPPQPAGARGAEGGTGLYCGEQDMFCFLVDPTGWAEIDGEAFAPGFFLWNSEVGKRTVGVQTFWFQAVCANHIVWDAVEVVEFSRKHTANVHESLNQIRGIIEGLVAKRDQRRDRFAQVIRKAMSMQIGPNADEALKLLSQRGITRPLAKEALQVAEEQGRLTIFAVVDALTRLAGRMKFAGDRTEVDQKASALLALAA
jgi:hypothetical protein